MTVDVHVFEHRGSDWLATSLISPAVVNALSRLTKRYRVFAVERLRFPISVWISDFGLVFSLVLLCTISGRLHLALILPATSRRG